jgi:hypothetical protein
MLSIKEYFQEYKVVVIIATISVVAILVYAIFLRAEPTRELFLIATPADDSVSESFEESDLLPALETLQNIKLNSLFFEDPRFKALSDDRVFIAPRAIGRRNPFLPLGKNPRIQ